MKLLNDRITLGEIALKVKDLKTMKDFYHTIIGLDVLAENATEATLGVDHKPLIHLTAPEGIELAQRAYTGLYHLALLVPDEADLGMYLYHFHAMDYSITGAGDHHYSQALYMNDPEGNGIEIYADRPRTAWDVNVDGTIPGATDAVDIPRLLKLAQDRPWVKAPDKTVMGHAHLQVRDLDEMRDFYQEVLGMELKTDWHKALFYSKGGYHHHVGSNTWAGQGIGALPENRTGLNYYTIVVDNLDQIKEYFTQQDRYATRDWDGGLGVKDGNDIWIKFVAAS